MPPRLPFGRSVRSLDGRLDQEHAGLNQPAEQHEIAEYEPRIGMATFHSARDEASETISGREKVTLERIRNDRAREEHRSERPGQHERRHGQEYAASYAFRTYGCGEERQRGGPNPRWEIEAQEAR